MEGVKDRLGDLSWLGISDRAWIEVDVPDPITNQKSIVDNQIAQMLAEAVSVIANASQLTKAQFQSWIDYQRKLENLYLNPEYPNELPWPTRPE